MCVLWWLKEMVLLRYGSTFSALPGPLPTFKLPQTIHDLPSTYLLWYGLGEPRSLQPFVLQEIALYYRLGKNYHLFVVFQKWLSFSDATGATTVGIAAMREAVYTRIALSTSLPVKMAAASQKLMFVMGTMTVVMNQMSWNTSVLHQRLPVLLIILSVTMETVLN